MPGLLMSDFGQAWLTCARTRTAGDPRGAMTCTVVARLSYDTQ